MFLGAKGADTSPVQAVLKYLGYQNSEAGPLFVLKDGTPLSRASFGRVGVRVRITQLFHIGAATSASERGLGDSMLQALGRWKSGAYVLYIRLH